ncbi:MAG: hypothetical protein WD651_11260 [Acidimicrobiia bacterium]
MRLGIPAAILAAFLLAPSVLGWMSWEQRLSSQLQSSMESGSRELYDIEVILAFDAELFHVNKLREFGTLAGVHTNEIHLIRVNPSSLQTIAGYYWVQTVEEAD